MSARTHVVGVADCKICKEPDCRLVTHSLGSCLGLTAYDPINHIGGLIHCLLPDSVSRPEKAKKNPYMFVNMGVPQMIREMIAAGAMRDALVLKAAGCAHMLNVSNVFDTGTKNYANLVRLLSKNGVSLVAEDVGGTIPRTLSLDVSTGKVLIASLAKEWEI